MNKKQILNRAVMVSGLALAMAAQATPVFAESGKTYVPVTGGQAVFEKYLTMDHQANVPNTTFNFSIKAGEAQNSDGLNTLKVYAGDDANAVTGSPTIANNGNVNFKVGDPTFDSVQKQPNSVTVQKQDDGNTINNDKVTKPADGDWGTNDNNKKYARHDVRVDFSKVQFKEPGVYRYIVNETPKTQTQQGITNDSDVDRVLDVYVIDEGDGALKVQGYVLHDTDNKAAVGRNGTTAAKKSMGYTNDYTTHDLTISKKVTGNQASRDEYFKFTVKISNAVPGTKYDVNLSNADSKTKTNAINIDAAHGGGVTNPSSLTADANGNITQDFWLQNNQSIIIYGIAPETGYSINEDQALMDNEGYDPSATITGDTKTGTIPADVKMDGKTYTVADTALTDDTTVAYTNNKAGIIPTGTILTVAPYVLLVGVAVAGATIYKKNKKREA